MSRFRNQNDDDDNDMVYSRRQNRRPQVVRLVKGKNTGQIVQQTYQRDTLLSSFKEKDFLALGSIIYYNKNNLDVTSDSYVDKIILPSGLEHKIGTDFTLADFNGVLKRFGKINTGLAGAATHGLSPDRENFTTYVTKMGGNLTAGNKLQTVGRSVGYIPNNLLYLNKFKDSKIDLASICSQLADEFENASDDIQQKDNFHYERWRNDYIKDTLNSLRYSKVNKSFIGLILFNLFEQCMDEFETDDYQDAFVDGRKRRRRRRSRKMSDGKRKRRSKRSKRSKKSRSKRSKRSKKSKRRSKSRSKRSKRSKKSKAMSVDGKRKRRSKSRSKRSKKSKRSHRRRKHSVVDGRRRRSRSKSRSRRRSRSRSRSRSMSAKKLLKLLRKM